MACFESASFPFYRVYPTVDCSNNILSVERSSFSLIKIFPNPVSDALYFKGLSPGSSIALYDVQMKKVFYTSSYQPSESISTAKLSKGIYLIRVQDREGKDVRFIKLVKH